MEKTVNHNERTERFISAKPIEATVQTRSGDVTIRTGTGSDVEVVLTVRGEAHRHLLEHAVVEFDSISSRLTVRSTAHANLDSLKGWKSLVKSKSWFDLGGSDVDVTIIAPQGSSVDVSTASGDVRLSGLLSEVKVSSASGDVELVDDVDVLDVKTASGDVNARQVRRSLECRSASGDVRCTGAAAFTVINTASGDVAVKAVIPGELTVRAVSGDVKVSVQKGLAIDVDGTTLAGDLGSNISLDGADGGNDEFVAIKVSTVSGDLRIDRAS